MIALAMALMLVADTVERCEVVQRDHEQFKIWAFGKMKEFEASKNGRPSAPDRVRWAEFEKAMELRIDELNRRYAHCAKD